MAAFSRDEDVMREPTDDEFSSLMNQKDPGRNEAYNLPTEEEIAAAEEIGYVQQTIEDAIEDTEGAEEAQAAAEGQKILGKFETQADLEKAYLEIESAYGARSQDTAEKRRLEEELAELRGRFSAYAEQANAQPAQPVTQDTVDWVETSLLQDPNGTMEWVRVNQPALYERAIQTWGQLDPMSAARYDTQLRIEANNAEMNARLAATAQPAEAMRREKQLETAWNAVMQARPELAPYAGDIEATAAANPWLAGSLANAQTVDETARIIENLLYTARGRRADAVNEATTGAVTQQAEAARTAKQRAGVTAPANGGERAPRTPVTAMKQKMLEGNSVSIHDELERNRAKAAKSRGR